MKYIITESQINKAVFSYLNKQNFIKTEDNDCIYFLKSSDDKYAQIRYDISDGWCYIDYDLIREISYFFSMKQSDSEQVIGDWVSKILEMKVTVSDITYPGEIDWLNVNR